MSVSVRAIHSVRALTAVAGWLAGRRGGFGLTAMAAIACSNCAERASDAVHPHSMRAHCHGRGSVQPPPLLLLRHRKRLRAEALRRAVA